MNDHSDSVTLCRAPGFTLTKTYRELPDGRRVKGPTGPPPSQIAPYSVGVDGLDDLARLLRWLLSKPELYVTRAEPMDPRPGLRGRLASDAHGDGRDLRDVPRRWVCLDVDDLPTPDGLDPESDLEAAAEELRRALPEVFHTAGCCVVWSRSFGTLGYLKLKAHCWFWLDRPAHGASLKAWLKAEGAPVDEAIFSAGQPHFTAAPHCVGFEDPLEGRRVTMLEGAPAVVLPEVVQAEAPERHRPHSPRKAREGAARVLGQDVEPTATEEDVRAALARISPDALRSEWYNVYLALWSGLGSAEQAFELFDEWSARGSKYEGRAATYRMCASFPFTSLGVDRLWALAGWRPAPKAEPFEGLEAGDMAELRRWLHWEVGMAWETGGVHVLDVPIGAGKSHTARRLAEVSDVPTIWLAPTNDLRDEAEFKGSRIVATRTRENCEEFGTVTAANRASRGGGAEFCARCPKRDECPFILGRGEAEEGHRVMSHAMYVARYGAQLEDVPMRRRPAGRGADFVAPLLTDEGDQIKVTWEPVTMGSPFAVRGEDAAETVLDVAELVDAGRYEPFADLLVIDESMARTSLPFVTLRRGELAGLVTGELPEDLEDLDWSALELRRGELRAQFLAALKAEDIRGELALLPDWRAVEGLAQAVASGGVGTYIAGGRLVVPFLARIDTRRARAVLALDATASAAQVEALFGDATWHRARCPKPDALEVHRVDAQLSGRDRGPEGWRYETKAALWRATHLAEDGPSTLHVVHKAWAAEAEAELVGPVIWFEGTTARGSNDFEDLDRVCASTWRVPGRAVTALAETYAHLTGRALAECEDAARLELEWAPVRQALGRIRPYSADAARPKRIVLVDTRDLGALYPELRADRTEAEGEAQMRAGYVYGEAGWRAVIGLGLEGTAILTQKGLRAAWNAGCRAFGDSPNHRGAIPECVPPPCDGPSSGLLERAAGGLEGVTTIRLRSSAGGPAQLAFTRGPISAEDLRAVALEEGWNWAATEEGERVWAVAVGAELLEAAWELAEMPETAKAARAALGAALGVAESTVRRRMAATGVTLDALRSAHVCGLVDRAEDLAPRRGPLEDLPEFVWTADDLAEFEPEPAWAGSCPSAMPFDRVALAALDWAKDAGLYD